MCSPNAKEVKTNQNAKLWVSCKAFVNTPDAKACLLWSNDLIWFSCSHYQVVPLRSHCSSDEGQIECQIAFRTREFIGENMMLMGAGLDGNKKCHWSSRSVRKKVAYVVCPEAQSQNSAGDSYYCYCFCHLLIPYMCILFLSFIKWW